MIVRMPARIILTAIIAFALLGGLAAPAIAQDAASPVTADSIEILGDVTHPGTWSIADLQALPTETVEADYQTDTGEQQHHSFTGARLWDVLQLTVSPDDPPGQAMSPLTSYLVLRAKDGYFVVFSLGEIAPDYGDQPYLLIWEIDGQPLSDVQRPLMLVAPGDHTDGRFIYGITSIEVRGVPAETAA